MEKEGLSDDTPVSFELLEVKVCEGNSVWLRYKATSKECCRGVMRKINCYCRAKINRRKGRIK